MIKKDYNILAVGIILLLHFFLVVSSGWNTSIPVDFDRNLGIGQKLFSHGEIYDGSAVLGQGLLFTIAPILLGVDLKSDSWSMPYLRSGNNKGLLAFHNMLDKNEMNAEFYNDDVKSGNENSLRKVLRLGIIIEGIISMLTALIIFIWAKGAFGLRSGYLALIFYSFSPFSSGLVHGLHADNMARLMITLTFYWFWKFLTTPDKKNLIFSGLSLGAAMSVKITTAYYPLLFFILMIISLVLNEKFKERIKSLFKFKSFNEYTNVIIAFFLISILALITINSLFLFNGIFKPISEYDNDTYQVQSELFLKLKNSFIGKIPLPISSKYISALDNGLIFSKGKGYLFFMGKFFPDDAPKTFYLVSFLVKTTLPVIILFVFIHFLFILLLLSKNTEKTINLKFNFIFLLFFFYFIFLFTTFVTSMVAGLRHLGMLYPIIFVLISSIVTIKLHFLKYIKTFVWIMVVWQIVVYLIAYPFFIPYFNELIGNNNGYLYFRDTNIDYHELYYYAIDYKEKHPEVILFPNCFIEKGKVSMSPNDLNFQRARCYAWLKNFEPIDFIGNSWPVYDVDGRWIRDENGQVRFLPSSSMQPRKAKINMFLEKLG